MFAFPLPGLAPWELVAFSALCAASALTTATAIGVGVAYLATRAPRVSRQSAPVRAPQPQAQPGGPTLPAPSLARAAGA
jgi:hypothetical protein